MTLNQRHQVYKAVLNDLKDTDATQKPTMILCESIQNKYVTTTPKHTILSEYNMCCVLLENGGMSTETTENITRIKDYLLDKYGVYLDHTPRYFLLFDIMKYYFFPRGLKLDVFEMTVEYKNSIGYDFKQEMETLEKLLGYKTLKKEHRDKLIEIREIIL